MSAIVGRVRATREGLLQLQRKLGSIKEVCTLLKIRCRTLALKTQECIDEAEALRARLEERLEQAYDELAKAYSLLGSKEIDSQAAGVEKTLNVEVRKQKVLDVAVPIVGPYSRPSLNRLFQSIVASVASMFAQLLDELLRIAETEARAERFSYELGEVYRRLSTIEKVIVPEYERTIKYIEGILAEEALEDLMRDQLRFMETRR